MKFIVLTTLTCLAFSGAQAAQDVTRQILAIDATTDNKTPTKPRATKLAISLGNGLGFIEKVSNYSDKNITNQQSQKTLKNAPASVLPAKKQPPKRIPKVPIATIDLWNELR